MVFATKMNKNTLLRAHFSALKRFLVDLGAPAGSQNEQKSSNFVEDAEHFWRYCFEIVLRACLETYWDRSGRLRGRSGDSPGGFLEEFWSMCSRKYVAKTSAKIVWKILSDTLGDPTSSAIFHKSLEPNPCLKILSYYL